MPLPGVPTGGGGFTACSQFSGGGPGTRAFSAFSTTKRYIPARCIRSTSLPHTMKITTTRSGFSTKNRKVMSPSLFVAPPAAVPIATAVNTARADAP